VILARKFSVRNFWHDVRRTRATLLFYIGEMARYLVQAPPDPIHPDETKTHGLELIYGLGITAPIWRAFRDRFGVPWISEYYGATEATTSIAYSNFSNKEPVAKVAHWGPLLRSSWFGQDVLYIIRIDMELEEVIRDPKTGLCIQCDLDEVGEAISRIRPPLQRTHDYVGEGGAEATEKKILRDVFEKGDAFWRVGDALAMVRTPNFVSWEGFIGFAPFADNEKDKHGYITFKDRLGDTYRAKGHNISTAEVESAFLNHPHISSANVYAIPMSDYGYEGQVGCAAVTFRAGAAPDGPGQGEQEALTDLEKYLTSTGGLAGYAVPRFLRVLVDNDEESATERDQIGISDDVGSEYVSSMLKKLKTGLRKEGMFLHRVCSHVANV
jgi:acyl-CoA synthetase (AMP-forming)/AMP-acid ligase II